MVLGAKHTVWTHTLLWAPDIVSYIQGSVGSPAAAVPLNHSDARKEQSQITKPHFEDRLWARTSRGQEQKEHCGDHT